MIFLGELVILEKLKPADCVCTKKPKPLCRDVGDLKRALSRHFNRVHEGQVRARALITLICKLVQLTEIPGLKKKKNYKNK